MKRGFIKGEALRLLRTNSSKTLFEESVANLKTHLLERRYPENFIQTTLSEVTYKDRNQTLRQKQKQKQEKKILPFVTIYDPAVPHIKLILMNSWHFITQQPLLNDIFKEPPLISYTRGRSRKDILVRAKPRKAKTRAQEARRPVTLLDTKKRITNQNCSYNFWLKHARGSRASPSPFLTTLLLIF